MPGEHITALLPGLYAVVALMVLLWLASIPLRNVSIIDLFWGVAVATGGTMYWWLAPDAGPRADLAIALAWLWALRLFVYLFRRNHGKPEDRRYVAMREKRSGFAFKSLYIVFLLQAVLAWLIGLPLYGTAVGEQALGWVDAIAVGLFLFGLAWEAIGDAQLADFLGDPANKGQVMNKGVWRYSRHPNYFGEFVLWWALWLLALGAGYWWTFVGPLLLSFFLLKVSGVALLEKDISERRPAYQDYVRRTSAFIPRRPDDSPSTA